MLTRSFNRDYEGGYLNCLLSRMPFSVLCLTVTIIIFTSMKSDGLQFARRHSPIVVSNSFRTPCSYPASLQSRCAKMRSFSTSQGSNQSKYLVLASRTNEKVKLMKSLHVKKNRDSEGMLLLEGHRQIVDAINSGYHPSTLLFSDEAVNAPLGKQLLVSLEKCGPSTVFRASNDLIQSISDTVHCQGVIASFSKPRKAYDFTAVESPLVVLMDRPTDPGNLGTIIRTAYGMGVDAVVIVDGCDPWSPKVLRSAMGMCLKFPILEASWKDNSVSTFLQNSAGKTGPFQLLLADADPSGSVYHRVDMTGPTVLVVGSEAAGIGAEARSLLGAKYIRIPTPAHRDDVESFNAAVAGSILIAEAARQREGRAPLPQQ